MRVGPFLLFIAAVSCYSPKTVPRRQLSRGCVSRTSTAKMINLFGNNGMLFPLLLDV